MNEEHLHDIRSLAVKSSTTQELTAELKRRGLGVYNMSMPFKYFPAVKHIEGSKCRKKFCKKHK